ncbi:unnamed protein product [Phaedon cochleariae]|uniref:SAM domain-containing protein n=1 Tax=Phaedon cochleariae TaxID=80249 RepID=A0A9P0DK97_PHACE|nr:unnamed protein product [Phaedon cochleariae]
MREVACNNGDIVAAIVAENPEEKYFPIEDDDANQTPRSIPETKNPTKNNHCSDGEPLDRISFESAVNDFNSVVEDVQKFCASDSLKRNRKTAETLDRYAHAADDVSDSGSDGGDTSSDSDVEKEHVINEGLGLATIAEAEEVSTVSSAPSYQGPDDDSSLEDCSTLKEQEDRAWSETFSNQGSTSDLSTSSSERQSNPKDSSTRCDADFRWIRKEPPACPPPRMEAEEEPARSGKPPLHRPARDKPARREKPAPGSLDRRRHHSSRQERDQKSRSSHILKSPSRLDDFASSGCQGWCCNGPHDYCFETFQRRHERLDPQRYGSNPLLEQQHHQHVQHPRGSHPDIYGDFNGNSRDRYQQCCSYHGAPPMPPPCCFFGDRGYHWTPPPLYPKPGEQDEKFRKLQYEKDNLQLQVQVLTDQIEAQSEKITDLEKLLMEKKHLLSDTEDKLQREVLSRSSLETQKLELMSIVSELKLQQAALERENLELRSCQYNNNSEIKKPPLMPRMSSQPTLTSTPVQHVGNQQLNVRMSPAPSPVTVSGNSPRRIETTTTIQEISEPKTPPANYKRQIDIQYGSLPRQQFVANGVSAMDSNMNPKKGVAFGRGLYSLIGGRYRGFSVPNLAETEKVLIEDGPDESPGSPSVSLNKTKGIKKIFGKMKRSGSGNLEDLPGLSEFQRGGVRATAAARLGWSEPQISAKPDKPFAEWTTDNVCDWLQDLGLDAYTAEAKRWVRSGQQLQEASIGEIEKELNVKNPLHRKKLQLAIIDTQANGSSDLFLAQAGRLDTAWVLRWLDDTGLPQHKENFLINRVDGRVLHRLTIDDLALLHVTSMLHVASIKRGIQVLRENNYEPGCLQRRSLPEEPSPATPKQISLWTTHRVMEWLRAVDLAEYAPNLRGSGVHGGLMVREPKFDAELLASLLSIPPGKTLLRRHLNTHFKELLGKEIIQEKRELEATLGYVPLTPSAKLKVPKKSQFSLKRKKSKGEADYGDLVCPLNPEKSGELTSSGLNSSVGMMRTESLEDEGVSRHVEFKSARSLPASVVSSPVPQRHV